MRELGLFPFDFEEKSGQACESLCRNVLNGFPEPSENSGASAPRSPQIVMGHISPSLRVQRQTGGAQDRSAARELVL